MTDYCVMALGNLKPVKWQTKQNKNTFLKTRMNYKTKITTVTEAKGLLKMKTMDSDVINIFQ